MRPARPMFVRRLRWGPALVALALLTAGCLRFDVATTVAADGSGQLTVTTLFDAEVLEAFEEAFGAPADSSDFDASMPPEAVLSDVEVDGFEGRRAVIAFATLDELNAVAADVLVAGPDTESAVALFDDFAVTRQGTEFVFAATYPELEVEQEGEIELDAPGDLGEVEVRLTLPGVVYTHDADEVVDGELIWRFSLEGPRTLQARGQTELVAGFPDVAGNVHADAIAWVAEQEITTGFPDGTFRPGEVVSRGQMATFLTRALQLEPGSESFPDAVGSVHEEGIAAVAAAEITTGFPDGTFRPGDEVTRGQMATFLFRALAD